MDATLASQSPDKSDTKPEFRKPANDASTRKYDQLHHLQVVSLHFWGTGKGVLPVVSFLLLRDCCIRLSSDCLDVCLKGIYKAYVVNCQFVTPTKLQHIEFLGSCIVELYGVDLPNAYQHAFVFIRHLGMILRDAITVQTKDEKGIVGYKQINSLVGNSDKSSSTPMFQHEVEEHKHQLERLKEKDPEFYQFLQDHDKELLEFGDDEPYEDADDDTAELLETPASKESQPSSRKVLTTAMVDTWCKAISETRSLGAIRSLMRAFRSACHYGDDGGNESVPEFSVMTSGVFNSIMVFVLSKADGIFRTLLKLPESGGKKETIIELIATKAWKNYGSLVKSYLANSLHVLQQMTDTEMISFTLQRLRYSSVFLAAFPSLLRRYIKVSLHFWGTGKGALPVVSFLLLRDCCIRLSSDCLDVCLKGIYKAYVVNCQFVTPTKLQHIEFLGSCIVELYGVDLPNAYQHAFVFIRHLGMILRDAITVQTKDAYRKVYEWKYLNCLELWTRVICAYKDDPDFRLLSYPLTQIISGAAYLVPTAKYFPLRLRCARMLNQITVSTGSFIPISSLLADMLEFKELNKPTTGGVGKAVNFRSTLKISKQTIKTLTFQEECVFSVIEQLGEHLAQWSYSIFFYELAFIPLTHLRSFCKSTNVERFRREARQLIQQIEANIEFTNSRRASIAFSPKDQVEVESFLEVEKKSKLSPLSQYVHNLSLRADRRRASVDESIVLVGEKGPTFTKGISEIESEGVKEGDAVFKSNWLPGSDTKKSSKSKRSKKRKTEDEAPDMDEDVVTELELSSDEDELSDTPFVKGHSERDASSAGSNKTQQKTSNDRGKKRANMKGHDETKASNAGKRKPQKQTSNQTEEKSQDASQE